jgi:site-specific DNA-methyltransferase (adenine-specific)
MPLKECADWPQNGIKENAERRTNPRSNNHPTVKPISLMKYIITLLAPPGSPTLLDPFCGSGSTLVASKELGISAIGIEKEYEYVEIATKRLDAVKYCEQMEMFNEMD